MLKPGRAYLPLLSPTRLACAHAARARQESRYWRRPVARRQLSGTTPARPPMPRGSIRIRPHALRARAATLRQSRRLPSAPFDRTHKTSQFLRESFSRKKEPRLHRAHRYRQEHGNFLKRIAFHRCEQQHKPLLFRQFIKRAIKLPLKLRSLAAVSRVARIFKDPLRLPLLPSFCGAQTIEREPKTDANKPCTKTRPFAQSFKLPVCAKQSLLRNIFSIGIIAQDPARYAKRQRSVFREQRFPFAMRRARRFCARSSARGGSFGLSSGMRQDPLLHGLVQASGNGSALLVHRQDAADGERVHRQQKK